MTQTRDYLRKRGDDLVRDAQAGTFMPSDVDRQAVIEKAEAIAKQLRMAPNIAHVAGLVRSNGDLAATVEQWDKDPMLLGGKMTIDLRDGRRRMPQPADYIIKHAACAPSYDPPMLWLQCLDTWTDGDASLQSYLQRMCGYILTGSVKEEVFFFFYGLGKNGKTKFAETIKGIMGDYAGTMGSEVLMASQHDRHPTEIARLRGLRLAVASEIEQGKAWAESKIKSLTGGDRLQARFMRENFFEFDPTFKLLVIGNNKPSLSNVDEAIKRRLHLIPFTVTIPEDKRDPDLAAKLREEWPQILGWMVGGCLEWQRIGLQPPAAVLAATADYLTAEDTFGQWRSTWAHLDVNGEETLTDLWDSWMKWANTANEKVGSQKRFYQLLGERGFKKGRENGTGKTTAKGLRLIRIDSTAGRKDLN
jgi:putative DNA primase/helicase